MTDEKAIPGAKAAMVMATVAFTTCFAAWVINAVLVSYLVATEVFTFDAGQVGWLLALPILTGAISRVPLGIMTDKYGGRIVLLAVMLFISVPLFMLSYATEYTHFLLCSLGFGLAGGSFAVGVGYVSTFFSKAKQGTALGVFGMGNAGASATTIFAPTLLNYFTADKSNLEGWRTLPKLYAALVVVVALAFFFTTQHRVSDVGAKPLKERLAPLKSIIVWRFGLYYFFVFGSFVTLAQWIIPYSTNVYGLSVVHAGFLASAFSLPSGVIRALGGWLSDRLGPRSVMYWVFGSCVVICALLAIPRMQIESAGAGINAKKAGVVGSVTKDMIEVAGVEYKLAAVPAKEPAALDDGSQIMPSVAIWHETIVEPGETVAKKQLVARGVSNIYYPANLWIFAVLVVGIGVATGIGKAGVYKFIPDQFPDSVGAVGGMVGLIGAMGGFFLPPIFGYLLTATGLWSSCWMVLAVLGLGCLTWMHLVARKIMKEEAPDLARMIERLPGISIGKRPDSAELEGMTVHELLSRVSFFKGLGDEQLKIIGKKGRVTEFKKGENVFEQGDAGDRMYVILHGSVRIHRSGKGLADVAIALLKDGNFFGELALLDGDKRSAAATAASDTKLLEFGRQDFLQELNRSPHLLSLLLAGLSRRIRKATDALHVQARGEEEVPE
jgi:NNP family nitrate/nitrite transporter-like MFS transporter